MQLIIILDFPFQIWCSKYRQQAAESQVNYGVHSPGKFRYSSLLSPKVDTLEGTSPGTSP